MRLLSRSLGNKVLGLACLIAALSLGGILLATALWQRRTTLREIDRMGHQVSGLMEAAVDDPMVRGDGEALNALFRRAGALNSDITVHLTNADGRISYSTRTDLLKIKVEEAHPSPEVGRLLPEALRHNLETGTMTQLQGRPTFLRVKTLPNEPRCQGCHGDQRPILGAMVLLKDASAEWEVAGDRNRMVGWLSLASLCTIALGLGFLVARAITRPLADFGQVLSRVAAGDLRTEARIASQDEVGRMGEALNEAIQRLRDSFREIQESAQTIGQASSEIAAGNQDLSGRTEEQAASLEETASSLEEFTATVRQAAENARRAAEAATRAEASAGDGQASVARLVGSMEAINLASGRINEIIGVVDDLAFQTNLLALNAAVEAARAGEQGRGFAVVASEVRNLARRSAEAAREIKGLIRDSVAKAQDGQLVATHTGDIIQQSVTEVRRVREIIGEIAAATHEQATGIQEINRAVTQMDQVTQQNAALVEEAAAAAESLDDQTQSLRSILARFRTQD